jgi:two-component system KDP operon response regulator KdpE
VVDDEPAIQRFLKPALEANDYEVARATTVGEALRWIAKQPPDVVVLDLGLPDGDGKDVIRRVRQWSDVPIVVLSAREREAEKIEALDLGADDFVNKPFGVGELMARLRTALRHRNQAVSQPGILKAGALEIDIASHRVVRAGSPVKLQLLTAVWGPAQGEEAQYLRVYIGHLRQKLEDNPDEPKIILTELGIGYRLVEA